MKVLITGACGFIGRHLIKELEQHGHELVLVDRQRPEEATIFAGAKGRLAVPLQTDWPFHVADIMDAEAMCKAVDGVDAVVHLAGIPTGEAENGIATFTFNAMGTFTLLDASRKTQVSRFIAASSVNAFGTFYWRINKTPVLYSALPLTEEEASVPQDPYSLSKLVNEETCAAFQRAYGIRTAALRFGAVWSEDLYDTTLNKGLQPTQKWNDDLFTWVHVRDIATGIRQALETDKLPDHGVYTLNASDTRCPEQTMELLERFRPDYLPRLTTPVAGRDALISTKRARDAFGFVPTYRLS